MAKEIDIKKILKDQTEKLIEVFDDRIKTVQEEFNGINKKLDAHADQIGNLTMDMIEVKSDLQTIKFEMVAVLNAKADKKHIVDLDRRIRTLEKNNKA